MAGVLNRLACTTLTCTVLVFPLLAASPARTAVHAPRRAHTTPERLATAQDSLVLPPGWRRDGRLIALDLDSMRTTVEGGPSVRIVYGDTTAYAGVVERLDVNAWRGRTLRLSGEIARSSPKAAAGIWVGAWDSTGTRIAYTNSYEQPVPVAARWTTHAIELAIPSNAVRVLIGAAVYDAPSTFWVGALRPTVVARGTP